MTHKDELKQIFLSFAVDLIEQLIAFGLVYDLSPDDIQHILDTACLSGQQKTESFKPFSDTLTPARLEKAQQLKATLKVHHQKAAKVGAILSAWHSDDRFAFGAYGAPGRLAFSSQGDDSPCFEELVNKYGNGMSAAEALNMMLKSEKVRKLDDGFLAPLSRDSLAVGDEDVRLQESCALALRALKTAMVNAQETDAEARLVNRYVSTNKGLTPEVLKSFTETTKDKSHELLYTLADYLEQNETDAADAKNTGITVFQFVGD